MSESLQGRTFLVYYDNKYNVHNDNNTRATTKRLTFLTF